MGHVLFLSIIASVLASMSVASSVVHYINLGQSTDVSQTVHRKRLLPT